MWDGVPAARHRPCWGCWVGPARLPGEQQVGVLFVAAHCHCVLALGCIVVGLVQGPRITDGSVGALVSRAFITRPQKGRRGEERGGESWQVAT